MPTPSANDLADFHRFVGEKIRNGDASASPEDVLDEWRSTNLSDAEHEALMDDIQEAIDDIERGEVGMPFDEYEREMRVRLKLPPKTRVFNQTCRGLN